MLPQPNELHNYKYGVNTIYQKERLHRGGPNNPRPFPYSSPLMKRISPNSQVTRCQENNSKGL